MRTTTWCNQVQNVRDHKSSQSNEKFETKTCCGFRGWKPTLCDRLRNKLKPENFWIRCQIKFLRKSVASWNQFLLTNVKITQNAMVKNDVAMKHLLRFRQRGKLSRPWKRTRPVLPTKKSRRIRTKRVHRKKSTVQTTRRRCVCYCSRSSNGFAGVENRCVSRMARRVNGET